MKKAIMHWGKNQGVSENDLLKSINNIPYFISEDTTTTSKIQLLESLENDINNDNTNNINQLFNILSSPSIK